MTSNIITTIVVTTLVTGTTFAQEAAPTSSLMVTHQRPVLAGPDAEPHALLDASLFAIEAPQPPEYRKHDLVQIIVREASQATSTHELETKKEYALDSKIQAWPHLDLSDILNLQLMAGQTSALPAVKLSTSREAKGEGDYERSDDLTARLTAEVVEVLPNGNLILEARTFIKNDDEEMTIKVTGVCRPTDITLANTIISTQIHDLRIEKMHEGQLKKANEKGLIPRVFDAIFAF